MSGVNGKMLTCDRCGSWIFLKCTGEGQADGGYTRWNTFEQVEGWDYLRGVGTMCPKCWEEYNMLLEDFKNRRAKDEQ